MQLNIRTKITLGFGLIITIILILATYLFYSTNQMSSNLKEVDTRVDSLDTVRQTEAEFYQAVAAIRGVIIYKKQEYIDQFDTSMKEMIRLQNHLLSISPPSEHKTINTLIEKTEFYHNGIMEEGAPILEKKAKALAEGKTDEVAFYDAEIARTSAYYGQVTTEITAILHELGEQNRLICDNIITASNESSNSIHKTALILGLFAVVIGIVISILLSRNITAPILEMVSGAKLFALGDFRNKLTVHTRDEIGELAQALNSMAVELGQLISKVVENAQTVAAHSEELAASGEQVSATVEEVASTANEVASVAANGVDNANKAATEIDKMNKAAQEGHKIVKQTIDKINAISDSTASANEAVKNLGDLSAKIGNITKVITDIAEQTNLLALNAAIEAARAGEQGRGFAVVAEEVRKLAEQSGSAAKEISDLIKQIQAGVDEAVHSMEQGTGDVKEGVEYAAMAGHELDNIINAVQDNIAFINDIAAGAKQTSEGTHQLSEANEQVTSTIQQITTAAQELARVSGELQHAVEKFKV